VTCYLFVVLALAKDRVPTIKVTFHRGMYILFLLYVVFDLYKHLHHKICQKYL